MNPAEIIHTIVDTVLDWVLGLRGTVALGGVFAMAFVETALFVGLVIPGETAMAIAGVLAARHGLSLTTMVVVGAVGAVAGDNLSYWVARRGGRGVVFRYDWIRHRAEPRLRRSARFFDRHGPKAILIGRWIGWLRAVLPFSAGLSEMPYGRFLVWTIIAGATWAATIVSLGYFLGDLFVQGLRTYATPIVLGFLAIAIGTWLYQRYSGGDDIEA